MSSTKNENDPQTISNDDRNEIEYEEEYHPNFLPILVLAFPIMPFFWKYHVRVTSKELSFGYSYSIAAKSADRSLIETVEPFDIRPLMDWGGWGIRLGRVDGMWTNGYVCQGGTGVKVIFNQDGKKSCYVFSCNDPETVCKILSA